MMDPHQYELIHRIHLNGIKAMRFTARKEFKKEKREYNTAYFDCAIGSRLATLAWESVGESMPEGPVKDFLFTQKNNELCHCCMIRPVVPSEVADRIAEYHAKILKEDGLISYLVCMPLLGERMAFATAFFGQHDDDPHTTIKGGLEEYYHTTTPLLLLAYLEPSEEELTRALRRQEGFLQMLGCLVDVEEQAITSQVCTLNGREAHNT